MVMQAFNGAVLLLFVAWAVVIVAEAITSSPTWDEVE